MEQRGCLSFLVASFLVLSWVVPFADSQPNLPAPWQFVFPPDHVHVAFSGEWFPITCNVPEGHIGSQFSFYVKIGEQTLVKTYDGNIFEIPAIYLEMFACSYWETSSTGESAWQWINSVPFSVVEPPRPPALSLQPQHPIYIQGEKVALVCSPPVGEAVAEYTFYYQARQGSLSEVKSMSHNVCSLDGKAAGTFFCVYWIWVSEQKIPSLTSNPISVGRRVLDPLPPPVLKTDPPSGAANEGEPLLISCLASRINTEKRFHFYKDGVEIVSSNEASLSRSRKSGNTSTPAVLTIPQTNSRHSGEFACRYEEKINSQWWVFSPRSQEVNITVKGQDSSLSVLVYVRLALVILIPVVSITCYCHWRRKKASKCHQELERPPASEEQRDYVNLEWL